MILVTVGTQLPFDRMVGAVDRWLGEHPDQKAFAQIAGGAKPRHMESVDFLEPGRYDELARQARLIVAHAGTGSIFTAMQYGLRLIIMPRRASLGEHRNEHQLATVKSFERFAGVNVAMDEAALVQLLEHWEQLEPAVRSEPTSNSLIERIASFINEA